MIMQLLTGLDFVSFIYELESNGIVVLKTSQNMTSKPKKIHKIFEMYSCSPLSNVMPGG